MRRPCIFTPVLFLAALGCDGIYLLSPSMPPSPPAMSDKERAIAIAYGQVVDRVSEMVDDPSIHAGVSARGLTIVNVAWEDTGRAMGSSLGPNISDLTLQVRRRDPRGHFAALLRLFGQFR